MGKWQQRKFYPRNPKKYRGDPTQIFMRSSWETSVAIWMDTNPSIIEWSSETIVVPYISPIDNKAHRYFVDFWMKVKDKNGKLITYLVEIKPYAQSVPPVVTKGKHKKTLLTEQATYLVNQAKWKYAEIYAKERGWRFIVLTEKEIYGKNPKLNKEYPKRILFFLYAVLIFRKILVIIQSSTRKGTDK